LRRLIADVAIPRLDGFITGSRRISTCVFARTHAFSNSGSLTMTLGTILIIILILILIGAIPNWGYSRSWGYGPSGIVGVVLVVVLILLLMGRI
jgi:hypothetical protein